MSDIYKLQTTPDKNPQHLPCAIPLTYTALPQDDGRTLNYILRCKLCISGTELKRCKRAGSIYINGEVSKTNAQVRCGDTICIVLESTPRAGSSIEPAEGTLSILFEDEHLLAVNKPPFMPMHPSPGHERDSLANLVMGRYAQSGFVFRAVGRLDRNTSGVALIARSAHAHNQLRQYAAQGVFQKQYIAIVHGQTPICGQVDAPIAKAEGATIRRIITHDGAPARTEYKRIHTENGYSVLVVTPRTGRTHQIRVHLTHAGHPLVGDFLYGCEEHHLIPRHALHCASIAFRHPISGQTLCIGAPFTEDFIRFIEKKMPNYTNLKKLVTPTSKSYDIIKQNIYGGNYD